MKLLLAAAALALALPGCTTPTPTPTPGSATAASDGTLTVVVSAKRVAICKASGGCGLYSRAELEQMVQEAAEAGARASCPEKSKLRI